MPPPTYKFFAIPAPPATCNAPVVILEELVVSVIIIELLTVPPLKVGPCGPIGPAFRNPKVDPVPSVSLSNCT